MRELLRVRNLILLALLCALPGVCHAQVAVSIRIGPPALPVYTQPPCPDAGYIWTPGYWAWGPDGYYWVPGVWVEPPAVGLLWTPGYWGFAGGLYAWHAGYWGPHVGFYGGIDYGFGYYGNGFAGGRWEGGHFAYNTAVWNVNRTVVRNVYVDRTVVRNGNGRDRASFNGRGGVTARPTAQDDRWAHEQHVQPTRNQMSHEQNFRGDHNALATVNHGQPRTVAMNRVDGNRFNRQGHAENVAAKSPAANRENNVRRENSHPFNANPTHPASRGTVENHNSNMNRENHNARPQNAPAERRPPNNMSRENHTARPENTPQERRPMNNNMSRPSQGHTPEGRPSGHPEVGHPPQQHEERGGGHPNGGGHPEHEEKHGGH